MLTTNDLENFELKLKEYSTYMFEQDVPVGFVMSDSGKFCLKFSFNKNIKPFDSLKELIDFVLNL